jgi:hypothetical protein
MPRRAAALRWTPRVTMLRRQNLDAAKIFFIIFVDAIFTTLFVCLFTNVFDVIAQIQPALACIACATPINSLAT